MDIHVPPTSVYLCRDVKPERHEEASASQGSASSPLQQVHRVVGRPGAKGGPGSLRLKGLTSKEKDIVFTSGMGNIEGKTNIVGEFHVLI